MTERHDDPSTLTGSYALDALSDDERTQVEVALASSPELRSETDSLRETALQLAYSTAPIEPPASLKASLMAQIQNTPQAAPLAPAASVPAASAAAASDPASSDAGLEARPASAPSPASASVSGPAETAARRRWFQRPAAALSAAAAVAVVFLGVGLGVGGVLNPGDESRPGTSQSTSVLDGIYAASDFQRSSTPVQGGGTATVVWSQDLGKSAVILDGVEAAPKGKTYELWYIDSKAAGGSITSAGLMDQYADGVHSAVLSGKVRDGVTVGITVEPAGGSKQPTTTPIAAVPLDA
ncbi:anti-sigma factor [Curtobacterium sp. 458]|uniref:anti-sigma factor n=1 Tax=Curtobacterium sp. 458 TaxID=3050069 RepID=UPI0025B44F0B|nr:anti-sigma factor [Curtobacterium sp. 458]WJY01427.1 anti-sigma factor [Curtobacterium sp. 458]